MLAWVGRDLIMALLHNPRSWASLGLIFILLRSLLINWYHVFFVYLVLAYPLPLHACKHLLGYQHPSSLHAQTLSLFLRSISVMSGTPSLFVNSADDLPFFKLTLHIHLIIILSALGILVISSTLRGQVSLS